VLQALGHEVTQLPTAILSNHPGWPHHAGRPVSPEQLGAMIDAIDANGWLHGHDAFLTGYLPTVQQVGLARELISRLRRGQASPLIVVDPILGDDPGGLYLPEAVALAIRDELVPLGDALTPNRFELGWLTGLSITTLADVRAPRSIGGRWRPPESGVCSGIALRVYSSRWPLSMDAPVLPFLNDAPWEQAPEYVRDVVELVTQGLGAALPTDVNELCARMAMVNSTTQSVSSSSLLIAAVLWGRESGTAPTAARGLARSVEGSAFDSVFIPEMADEGFAAGLAAGMAARAYDRAKEAPTLSDGLRRLLGRLQERRSLSGRVGKSEVQSKASTVTDASTEAPVTVGAVLLSLFEPEVVSPALSTRLRDARLEPSAPVLGGR